MASFLASADVWFGDQGLMSTELAARLIEFEETAEWQNWSPLWITDSLAAYYGWLCSGIAISLMAAAGIGGRKSLAVLLIWIIGWAHRSVWLQGPIEPALIACVAYLIVQPGVPLWKLWSHSQSPVSWTSCVTIRLLQTHWWLLVAAGLLSQLASLTWWRGEGVWWLASAGRSSILTVEDLRGNAALTNALTHGMIVVQMLALWLVTLPKTRAIGIVAGVAVSAMYALVADHVLYGLLLAACLPAFFTFASSPLRIQP